MHLPIHLYLHFFSTSASSIYLISSHHIYNNFLPNVSTLPVLAVHEMYLLFYLLLLLLSLFLTPLFPFNSYWTYWKWPMFTPPHHIISPALCYTTHTTTDIWSSYTLLLYNQINDHNRGNSVHHNSIIFSLFSFFQLSVFYSCLLIIWVYKIPLFKQILKWSICIVAITYWKYSSHFTS